jgi:hypothetical protein
MSLLQRVDTITRVWQMMVPHLPAPSTETVGRWLFYPDAAIEAAIMRTASKFKREKIDLATFDPIQAYRYTTGTAKLIAEQTRAGAA